MPNSYDMHLILHTPPAPAASTPWPCSHPSVTVSPAPVGTAFSQRQTFRTQKVVTRGGGCAPAHYRAPRTLPKSHSPSPEKNSAEQRADGWTQGHPATLPRRGVSEINSLASGISFLTLVCAEQPRGSYLRTPADAIPVSAIHQGQRGAGAQEEQRHLGCAPTRGRRERPSFPGGFRVQGLGSF